MTAPWRRRSPRRSGTCGASRWRRTGPSGCSCRGRSPRPRLDHQRRFITERLETARARLDDYRARAASGTEKRELMEAVLSWAREVGQGLDELTDEQRTEILQMVVEQVVIDRDNNVDITLAIPIGGDDNSSEPGSPEPESPESDSVAIGSRESFSSGSRWKCNPNSPAHTMGESKSLCKHGRGFSVAPVRVLCLTINTIGTVFMGGRFRYTWS